MLWPRSLQSSEEDPNVTVGGSLTLILLHPSQPPQGSIQIKVTLELDCDKSREPKKTWKEKAFLFGDIAQIGCLGMSLLLPLGLRDRMYTQDSRCLSFRKSRCLHRSPNCLTTACPHICSLMERWKRWGQLRPVWWVSEASRVISALSMKP